MIDLYSVRFVGPKARQRAKACAKGVYQYRLLNGDSNWAGSDLRGNAGRYGARYAKSRRALQKRIQAAGLQCGIVREAHRRIVMVIDSR
jgi:hypothetical protein